MSLETYIDIIVKKINLLKLCDKMYLFFLVLFFIFLVMASFIRIDERESVRGIINYEDEKKIVTICMLESEDNKTETGQKVVLLSEIGELEGVIYQIEKADIGLSDGNIIKYKIEITSKECLLEENIYYDFQLYNMKSRPLIYYLYSNI